MKKLTPNTLLLAFALAGLATPCLAAEAVSAPLANDSSRLVDGVSVEDFQAIQVILLKSAALDKDIAIIDAQMSALRAQRSELNFKAAAREHPELADKLKTILNSQRERQKQEYALARDAAKLFKQQALGNP